MKNLYLLPTDKSSKLFIGDLSNQLHFNYSIEKGNSQNLNIYITSNEDIKEGDWCYDDFLKSVFQANSIIGVKTQKTSKKIILTTDQELIADGVQAIPDEFLEWFVNNSSCEEVEVKHFGTCCGNQLITQCIDCKKYNPDYKIIIPSGEPKQIKSFEDVLDESLSKGKIILEELKAINAKQETLEEAALKYAKTISKFPKWNEHDASIFKDGAKWQQERMYSEEDMIAFAKFSQSEEYELHSVNRGLLSEFNKTQFKKK